MSATRIIRTGESTTLVKYGPEIASAIALTDASKTAAQTAQTAAELAQGIAEAAALTAPKVYATKSAGLAAVSEGETFWSDEDGGVKLYRDLSGVATLLDEILTAEIFSATGGAALVGTADGETVEGRIGRYQLATIAAMEALTPANKDTAFLALAGKEGTFVFSTANLSAAVTIDTLQAWYIAPDSDDTGASGAWVRVATEVTPEIAGAAGDGFTDDAAAINAADLVAALVNRELVFRTHYRVQSQLLMSASWRFEGGEIERDWTSTNTDKAISATIRGRGNDDLADFYVDPGPFTPTTVLDGLSMTGNGKIYMSATSRAFVDGNSSARMPCLYMLCDNFTIGTGMRFQVGGRDWCITYYGDGFKGGAFEIYGGKYIYEDGFHVIGGSGGTINGCMIAAGDDCFSFNTNFNQAMSNWTIDGPILFSAEAFGFKVANYRLGSTAAFGATTEEIKNIVCTNAIWRVPAGQESRNGGARFDTGAEDTALVNNCHFSGRLMMENNGLPAGVASGVPAIYITGSENCSMDVQVANPALETGYVEDAVNFELNIVCDDPPDWQNGGFSVREAVNVIDSTGTILNGRVTSRNRQGLETSNAALTIGSFEIVDVATGYYGISLTGTTPNLTVRDKLKIAGVSGAADARGISAISASVLKINGFDTEEINRPIATTAAARQDVEYSAGAETSRTVASGSITIYGDGQIGVLCQGGVSDTMSVISGGRKGQRIVLRNAEADPTTAILSVASSSNISVGGTRSLNTADSRLHLIYDGTNWVEVQFV